MRDAEGKDMDEIADAIKRKYGVEVTPTLVQVYYTVARSIISILPDNPRLMRRVLELYREGKNPVDAVIEIDGVTPEFAESVYEWYLRQERYQVENLRVTEGLVQKIITWKSEDGFSIANLAKAIRKEVEAIKNLAEEVIGLRNEIELAASTTRNLSAALTREVEELDTVVNIAKETIARYSNIPEKLEQVEDRLSRLETLVNEMLERQRKSLLKKLLS